MFPDLEIREFGACFVASDFLMNLAFRRILALVAVFFIAFAAVFAMRTCGTRSHWRDWLSVFYRSEQFRPEKYTLPEKPSVPLGDVEYLTRLNDEYANLTKAVVPSVVSIETAGVHTEHMLDIWGRARDRQFPIQGQGSGVIVTKEGHVITNHHVISGQQQIQVTLHDGKILRAHLVGEDTLLDVAVLKIEGDGPFVPLKFGDSSQAQVGQMVFAVGNSFGLGETVTHGIISAKERSISDNQRDLFQTDAAINPGNSGGPLVNLRGEIIGINVAIYASNKEKPGFQGVGFSIPSNDVKEALFQILDRGRPVRGFLGVQMHDLDSSVREILGYNGDAGSAVLGILPESPAQQAGLQPKDVIVSFNGVKIHSSTQLINLVLATRVGNSVKLGIWRKGQSLELNATIAESGSTGAPMQPSQGSAGHARDPEEILQAYGIEVRDLSVPERMQGLRGVVVTRLAATGLAAGLLQTGDLIIAVNNSSISGANDFFVSLVSSAAVQNTLLYVIRDGKIQRVNLPAATRKE